MRSSTTASAVLAIGVILATIGCAESTKTAGSAGSELPAAAEMTDLYSQAKPADEESGPASGGIVASTPQALNRKIIYNAEIELAVEDFSGVPDRVIALVKQFDAYVADSDLSGSSGQSRRGTWKIRVPVARFEEFTGAAKGLGELIRAGISSRDVSEEYYDVEARIRNKTKEEARLLTLLEERPGELKDVIAIERELSRVREELERMQGRLRVLADLTALTTVDLTILEIRNYQPPQAPTLATRIRRTFEGSFATLVSAGQGLLIFAVALVPWLPVLAVGLCPLYFVARRTRRPRRVDERAVSDR